MALILNSALSKKQLILGGARSGKSAHAVALAEQSGLPVTFIATAQALDDPEMAARIHKHRQERPAHWRLVEEPIHLASVLSAHSRREGLVLVDCLTLWLTNLLLEKNHPYCLESERLALLQTLPQLPGPVILVGNETGLGTVAMGALTRRFVDENGWLHQKLASVCSHVTLVVAGLPLSLKGESPCPLPG